MLLFHQQFTMIIFTLCLTLSQIQADPGDEDQQVQAKAVIHLQDVLTQKPVTPGSQASWGVVTLRQDYVEAPLRISRIVKGLSSGKHGISIQEMGNLEYGCYSAGDHFNPENKSHGGLYSAERHTGDLGNVIVDETQTGQINVAHCTIPLRGPKSIIGRMIIIYAEEDDLGDGEEEESDTTGASGERVGCGVIGVDHQNFNPLGPGAEATKLVPKSKIVAKAVLHNAQMLSEGTTPLFGYRYRLGTVTFVQEEGSKTVSVAGRLEGLPAGAHGFHIHTLGSLEDGCSSASGHFNPENKQHGNRSDSERHVGDLGNVEADIFGVAKINFKDTVVQLIGGHSIIGRALVLHLNEDDLGLGENAESKITGNAGPRIACGVVGIASEDYDAFEGQPDEQRQ